MRDGVNIMPIPGSDRRSVNFGVIAAQALEDRKVDGFWGNGMGAELAVRRGAGTVVLNVRRGDGPKACFNYTMPAIVTTDRPVAREPERSAPIKRHRDGSTRRSDLPHSPAISEKFVADMTAFAHSVGLLQGETTYDQVVAQQFRHLWTA
jgi:NitT/TauT family transport system substrate-binding protein